MKKWLLCGILALVACTPYPISRQYRKEAAREVTISMVQESPVAYEGTVVIWGGSIVSVANDSTGSELTILGTPLDDDGYPLPASYSQGRFKARIANFLDPAIFKAGMNVTLAGSLTGAVREPFDKGTYVYPELKILQLRYWPYVPSYYASYYPYYPYYGYPYYYGWPWYYGGIFFGYGGYGYHGWRGYGYHAFPGWGHGGGRFEGRGHR